VAGAARAAPPAPQPPRPLDLLLDGAVTRLTEGYVAGVLSVLPVTLFDRAAVHVYAGEFGAAAGLIEEAHAITAATGNAPMGYTALVLAAWRGDQGRAQDMIEAVVRDATARGEGRELAVAWYSTAVLYNGLGGYEAALAGAQRACEHEDFGFSTPWPGSEQAAYALAEATGAVPALWSGPRLAASRTGAATASPARRILLTRRTAARYAN
jgi:hypothetical protein